MIVTGAVTLSDRTERVGSAVRAGATRDRILAAARHRFCDAHYDDVTLTGIAADAGVTKQTVINVFGSKSDLFSDMVHSLITPWDEFPWDELPWDASDGVVDRSRLISALVHRYELYGDGLIRLRAVEGHVPAVAEALRGLRNRGRRVIATVFDDVLPERGRARSRAVSELQAALDVQVWKLLRRDLGFSARETAAAIERFVGAAVASFASSAAIEA